jgi:hypothetical protein
MMIANGQDLIANSVVYIWHEHRHGNGCHFGSRTIQDELVTVLESLRDYLTDTVRSVHQKTAVLPTARGGKSGVDACSHGGAGIPGASTVLQHYRQLSNTGLTHGSTCVLLLCISTCHEASVPSRHREVLLKITCDTHMRGACEKKKTCDHTIGAAYSRNPPQLLMQHEYQQP